MTQSFASIKRLLDQLLDEIQSSDDPSFNTQQVDFLEKRFFELGQSARELTEPPTSFHAPATSQPQGD